MSGWMGWMDGWIYLRSLVLKEHRQSDAKNLQHNFPKMRGGVKGRLELFRKFILFGLLEEVGIPYSRLQYFVDITALGREHCTGLKMILNCWCWQQGCRYFSNLSLGGVIRTHKIDILMMILIMLVMMWRILLMMLFFNLLLGSVMGKGARPPW